MSHFTIRGSAEFRTYSVLETDRLERDCKQKGLLTGAGGGEDTPVGDETVLWGGGGGESSSGSSPPAVMAGGCPSRSTGWRPLGRSASIERMPQPRKDILVLDGRAKKHNFFYITLW